MPKRASACLLAVSFLLLAPAARAQDPDPGDLIYQPTNEDAFSVVASGGFGDVENSWASSMQWFKGELYVGTSRSSRCASLATILPLLPIDLSELLAPQCPGDAADLPLPAEIWRYKPATKNWDRVYRSPQDIPVRQNPTKFTARDIAFRSMTIVKEPGGREALYVGGASAADIFPAVFSALGSPPPRILRTLDGTHWHVVPQAPGTFLGNLGKGFTGSAMRPANIAALAGFRGKLFAWVSDSLGSGVVISSSDPEKGNDSWALASPIEEEFPVTALTVFNGFVYCATAARDQGTYAIHKADASADAPLDFSLVFTGGEEGSPAAPSPWRAIAMTDFKNRLYIGTAAPAELVRLEADDSWELLVGTPRMTADGLKRPLSGVGLGMGSAFTVQFRSMAAQKNQLYLGTSDWAQLLDAVPQFADMAQLEFGFDLFRSRNGITWSAVSRNALGADHQPILHSMAPSPLGLFLGSASSSAGAEVWQQGSTTTTAGIAQPTMPEHLEAVSEELINDTVVLSWEKSKGATQYRVYRATVVPILDIISGGAVAGGLDDPDVAALLSQVCDAIPLVCGLVTALQGEVGVPTPFVWVATTTEPVFIDERETSLPALYFVRAENDDGQLSPLSNLAGGPSSAALITFPSLSARLDAAGGSHPAKARTRIQKLLRRAEGAARDGSLETSGRLLRAAEMGLKQGPAAQRVPETEVDDIGFFLQGLRRNVWLAGQDLIPLDVVLDGLP